MVTYIVYRQISPPAPDIEVPPEEHEVQIIDAETGELRSPGILFKYITKH